MISNIAKFFKFMRQIVHLLAILLLILAKPAIAVDVPTVSQTWTVTPSAGAGGSISPSTSQTVNNGTTTTFTVTPNYGYAASVGGTCGGYLSGTTYTTNAITANCTVSATFTANSVPVNGVCGTSNGTSSASMPTTNLCSSGTPSAVSGNGPWYWNCNGLNGGAPANCSATNTTQAAPVITSVGTASGTVNQSFSYQITANNGPTSYGISGLPAGLSVNSSTGLISGTPTASGTFSVTVTATNAGGAGSKAVTITIAPPSSSHYTKIANNGAVLPDSATLGGGPTGWACTRDNTTGLIWEVKTADGGLRDMNKSYTNYDDATQPQKRNQSGSAYVNPTQADVDAASNSIGFAKAVRGSGLCGYSDWRMPSKDELLGIVDMSNLPTINTTYFPNTPSSLFWSSSPLAGSASDAWYIYFGTGNPDWGGRDGPSQVRLVSTGQSIGTYALSVSAAGTGFGTVTSTDSNINCGSTCSANYTFGTHVTLAATPASGSSFAGWSGGCSGTGSCTVTMNAAQIVTAIFTTNPVPACTAISPSASSVTLGSSSPQLTATCSNSPTSYVWSLNGTVFAGCTGSTCTIPAANLLAAAAYPVTVTANNASGAGIQSAAATITVTQNMAAVPGAPTIGSATAGDARATVTFTAPTTNNGNSAITGYTVTSTPGNITAMGSSSPITVTRLTNGTSYTFTVTATNAVGTSSPSAASNAVTPSSTTTPTTDFTDNNDGTVTHKITGLTWKRCSEGMTWTGSTCSGTAQTYTWAQATALTSTFADKSDWRLPTIRELSTITDPDASNPAINSTIFSNTPPWGCWSVSAVSGNSSYAWLVGFGDGDDGWGDKTNSYSVRLVRGGQSLSLLALNRPATGYVDNGDGTVTHAPTALTWKRCAEGQIWNGGTCSGTATITTWAAAKALTSTFAGKSDWRLPTLTELRSLVDFTLTNPSINSTIFPNTPSLSNFWSVSPYAGYPGSAWVVYFANGNDYGLSGGASIRLVRGGQAVGASSTPADCLFNWAERTYPNQFAPAGATSRNSAPYYYRYYPQTRAYLATSSADNHLYYLGPISNNEIRDVGAVSAWLTTANCH
ncbi:MAG: DUF1566 domain-containing protein [Sulfuricellaceae bacterium]|nr:DUF1566 domain-containing protein [Sulfuricellaceae bacterium]